MPYVSGSVSYEGRVKSASGGNSYEAMSSFAGPLSTNDVVLSVPEYTDTGNGFKIRVLINPKLKGKCSLVEVRDGETLTINSSNNALLLTASSPMHLTTTTIRELPRESQLWNRTGHEPEMDKTSGRRRCLRLGRRRTTGRKNGLQDRLDKTKNFPALTSAGAPLASFVFNATISRAHRKRKE